MRCQWFVPTETGVKHGEGASDDIPRVPARMSAIVCPFSLTRINGFTLNHNRVSDRSIALYKCPPLQRLQRRPRLYWASNCSAFGSTLCEPRDRLINSAALQRNEVEIVKGIKVIAVPPQRPPIERFGLVMQSLLVEGERRLKRL